MTTAKLSSTATGVFPGQRKSMWPKGTTWADVAQANTMKNTWAPGTTWGDVKTAYDKIQKPATPAAADNSPTAKPFDAIYDATSRNLERVRDDTLTGIGTDRNRVLSEYGYNGTFDADGNLTGRTVDPNNPFSRMALLKRTYDQRKAGNTTSFAARGQLYSGALQNARAVTDFDNLRDTDQTEKSFDQIIAGLIGRQRSANTDYSTGMATAEAERLTRALGGL